MNKTRINHLEELNNSDYKIADDQPDINNWKIVDTTGKNVGKVKDMLFDKEAMKVRYIITNLKNGEIFSDDREVLIPIGKAQLNTSNERIVVPNVNQNQLSNLPHYRDTDSMTQEDEVAIRNAFGGTTAGTYDRKTFYDNDDFSEDKFYDADNRTDNRTDNVRNNEGKVEVIEEDVEVGKREVETGGARVSSRVVERPVEERVNLREENVKVNRNPVDRPANSADLENYQEKTIEETETKEVPVVNKEARVVEEVSLEKDVNKKEEVIKDTVKETKVDVDKNVNRNDNDRLTNTDNLNRDRDRLDNDKDRLTDDRDKNRNV